MNFQTASTTRTNDQCAAKSLGMGAALLALFIAAMPVNTDASPSTEQSRTMKTKESLTDVEREIVRAVDANNHEALKLLEAAVNINSGTMNFPGVKRVGELLRPKLESFGFKVNWIEGAQFNRAGHLVAVHPGPAPKGLLIGHLDTVFEKTSSFQTFKLLGDSKATGPAIIDMKGGDIIQLFALQALKEIGQLDKLNITMVLNGDEENPGQPSEAARRALRDAAVGAKWALAFEDGSGDPATAIIARRGYTAWTLTTTGCAAHSSKIFSEQIGAGAAFEAARILDAFYRTFRDTQIPINPALTVGGVDNVVIDDSASKASVEGKRNKVATKVIVAGDFRTLTSEELERTKAKMREVVAKHLLQTTAEIEFEDTYPPMKATDGNKRLLALYNQVTVDLGQGPVVAERPQNIGAGDVQFIANTVPMILDGLGLSGTGGHTDRETADLSMLPAKTKRTAVLLYRLSQEKLMSQ